MRILIKRPKWLKRPRSSFVEERELVALKRTKPTHSGAFRSSHSRPEDVVDAAFKAEIETLIRENAELLGRLAK